MMNKEPLAHLDCQQLQAIGNLELANQITY